MGFLDFIFGDDDPVQTTVTGGTSIPGYLSDFHQQQIGASKDLSAQPFQAFPGQLVAPLSGDQQSAIQANRDNYGAWAPALGTAMGATQQVMNNRFPDADIQSYMNPYLDPMTQAINDVYDQNAIQNSANAVQAGAFGGSREGVYQAENDRNRGLAIGDLQRQAFDNAQNAYRRDQASSLAGANQLGAQANQYQRQLGLDTGALGEYGALQQSQQQNMANANYGQFQREINYPYQMFDLRQSALAGAPYGESRSETTTGPATSNFAANTAGIAGLAGGIGSLFSTDGAGGSSAWSGMGDAASGIGNFFSGIGDWF